MNINKSRIIQKKIDDFKQPPNLRNYDNPEINNKITYFQDDKLNIAYNAIDLHVINGSGKKIALYFKDSKGSKEQYSFEDLEKYTNKFANTLKKLGLKKGENIFIFLPTIPERYISFLGTIKMGAIAVTLFSAFGEVALLDRLLDGKAKIIVTDTKLLPRVLSVWKNLPNLKKIIVINRGNLPYLKSKNIYSFEDEINKASSNLNVEHMNRSDAAYMLYTSGSTGKPKGIVHMHGDIDQIMLTTKWALDLKKDDVYWGTADAGWVTGVVYGILGAFLIGATSVSYEGRFSANNWYKILKEYKVSVWYTAPTAIRMLMGSDVNLSLFKPLSLRYIASVGEPLNPQALWWAIKEFGLAIHDNWWQTELGSICIANFQSLPIKPGSMGKPMPGLRVEIVDESGNEISTGKEGNLAIDIKTLPSFMKKVWRNKKTYNNYFLNGWYISGDRAIKDSENYFWFVGRGDDVIKTAGQRIGPFEIESVLIEHPAILEAGVIGKPHLVRGEIIKAFIVLKSGHEKSQGLKSNITEFIKIRLSANAYPREIEFVSKLPKTRSGKIMRRLLRAKDLNLPLGDTSALE